jgi:hypothetical protein
MYLGDRYMVTLLNNGLPIISKVPYNTIAKDFEIGETVEVFFPKQGPSLIMGGNSGI